MLVEVRRHGSLSILEPDLDLPGIRHQRLRIISETIGGSDEELPGPRRQGQPKGPVFAHLGEVSVGKDHDYSGHRRMDVAVDMHFPRRREARLILCTPFSAFPRLVQAQVKGISLGEREDVVENAVLILEAHSLAHASHRHARLKRLVALPDDKRRARLHFRLEGLSRPLQYKGPRFRDKVDHSGDGVAVLVERLSGREALCRPRAFAENQVDERLATAQRYRQRREESDPERRHEEHPAHFERVNSSVDGLTIGPHATRSSTRRISG